MILYIQVSATADRPAQRSASRPPCCTQMSTVSAINGHQFTTLTIQLNWQQLRRSAVPEIWLVPTKI